MKAIRYSSSQSQAELGRGIHSAFRSDFKILASECDQGRSPNRRARRHEAFAHGIIANGM